MNRSEITAQSADGTSIRFQVDGAGEPTLVLVHGWALDHCLWDGQVPWLSKTHRVVTLDLAGHGGSGRARAQWTMNAFGQDVQAVVEAVGMNAVILVGHSMGGPVVLEAARRLVFEAWTRPEHVRQWMLGPAGWTMPVCEIDLRMGGEWHFVWRKASGSEMDMRGRYTEVVPPERLVHTEQWGPEWPETINTLRLTEENGRTRSPRRCSTRRRRIATRR